MSLVLRPLVTPPWIGALYVLAAITITTACQNDEARAPAVDASAAPASRAQYRPLFEAAPMGAPWPEQIVAGEKPKVAYVADRLDNHHAEVGLLMVCGDKIAATAADVKVEGVSPAVAVSKRLQARFEREGFVLRGSVAGSAEELIRMGGALSERVMARGTPPTPEDIPKELRERQLEAALFERGTAMWVGGYGRDGFTRSLSLRCIEARCEVSVTEEMTTCAAPGGLMIVDLSSIVDRP
jgi:hypothetical protein